MSKNISVGKLPVLTIVGLKQNNNAAFVAVLCLISILVLCGIVLNSVVVFLMVKTKRYRRSMSNFFITHLSVVDLIFRIVCFPYVYLSLPAANSQNPGLCKTVCFLMYSCGAATFGSLVVIAFDRYQHILHPLKAFKKKEKPFVVVTLAWAYSLAASVTFIFTANWVPLSELSEAKGIFHSGSSTSCEITPGLLGGISITIYVALVFLVPMTIIIYTYVAVYRILSKRAQNGLATKAAMRSKAKSLRMLVIVVSSFMLCWYPTVVLRALVAYDLLKDSDADVVSGLFLATSALQLCSSLSNPLIYAFYNAGFKKDLANTLRPCLWRKRRDERR